jgi:hypothetical protein
MTAAEEDAPAADLPPKARAMSAMEAAAEGLAQAHAEAENAAQAGAAEHELVTEFVEELALALADGLNDAVGFYAGAVVDEAEYYSKTDLKQQVKDKTEELRGGDKPPLDEFVEQRLESVTVVRTTDHRQGAEYTFDFGTFKIETESGEDGRGHFRFDQFRNLIHESGGVNTAPPSKDRRGGEEWRDFMIEVIDDRGEERYTRGPRTQAVEALQNKVKRLTGYGTPEAALDHTGIWVKRPAAELPEWWQPIARLAPEDDRDLPRGSVQEIRVHESVIEPIIENAGITRSALYHELNARDITVPGTSGASMTQWVDGSDERFWTLLPDLGTPRTYVPDPNAAVAVTGGFDLSRQEEQDDEPQHEPENSEAAESDTGDDESLGKVSEKSDDGFESVGETK